MNQRYSSSRNPAMSVGWVFADLLLALAMLFLLANTLSIPPIPEPPPILTVSPANLDLKNPTCSGGTSHPQCIVIVSEATTSQGQMQWTPSSDMSDTVVFNPPK